jgi:shikimate kinase
MPVGYACAESRPVTRSMRNFSRRTGVFLVGFMGCGKTTVGELLSRRLGWRFEDLDSRIQARAGRSIPTIFSNQGEACFRQIEAEALLELIDEMASTPTVAALGGGTLVQPQNRGLIENSGLSTIFLDARVEDLWERCRSAGEERPLARDKSQFQQLYEDRRSLYIEAAATIDTTGKDVESVAAEIASWLQKARPKER